MVDRAELAEIVEGAGCRITARAPDGMPVECDCDDPWSKVRILDALATWDARYDPAVRLIAESIAAGLPNTAPPLLARAIERAVQARVRYLGEGMERFQPASYTWRRRLGDCDDTARLVVALARSVGLPAEVRAIPNHAGVPIDAAGVIGNRWAEASLPARWGEHPLDAFRRLRRSGRNVYTYSENDIAGLDDERRTARQALSDAWDQIADELPEKTDAALQMVQGVALGAEFSDGADCWKRCPGVCHNWGGLQLPGFPVTHDGSTPACPPGSAPCTDSHPNADGSQTSFGVCFVTDPDQTTGAVRYLRRLIVTHQTADVVGSGSARAMAEAMYASHYFGGFGATPEERIAKYAHAIATGARKVSDSLGEPLYVTESGSGLADSPIALGAGALALALLGVYGYRRGWHRTAAKAAKSTVKRIRARLDA